MVATGVGTKGIDGTTPGLWIEIETVAVRPPGQGKGGRASVEMLDDTRLYQSPGNKFRIILESKLIHQLHTDQVPGLYFNRQTAAGGGTVPAELWRIFCPGSGVFEVGVLPWKVVQHTVLS